MSSCQCKEVSGCPWYKVCLRFATYKPKLIGSTITDFKQIVKGIGGETNASQVVLSSSSTDSRLITKGPNKNTEGKRCYMVPVNGLSKVILINKIYEFTTFCRPARLSSTRLLEWTNLALTLTLTQSLAARLTQR